MRPAGARSTSSPTGRAPETGKEYEDKLREARQTHHLTPDDPVLFLEVKRGDASEFSEVLLVRGARVDGYLRAALQEPGDSERDRGAPPSHPRSTGKIPHVYFGWTEGNPIAYLLKFLRWAKGTRPR